MPSPRTRTSDAAPSSLDPVEGLRQLVLACCNRVLEEQEARRRMQLDMQKLRAEVLQVHSALRTLSRR
jgi:hypothetical protein